MKKESPNKKIRIRKLKVEKSFSINALIDLFYNVEMTHELKYKKIRLEKF